jgi:hypothetical protein
VPISTTSGIECPILKIIINLGITAPGVGICHLFHGRVAKNKSGTVGAYEDFALLRFFLQHIAWVNVVYKLCVYAEISYV